MILVSILGDFHSSVLPISYAFKEQIDKHVIIYDDAKRDVARAKSIVAGQKLFLAQKKAEYELITMQIDEDDYDNIYERFERIKRLTADPKDIYINTTDGLSSIAIVFSSHFLAIGANIVSYDRFANTYNLHTSQGMQKHIIEQNMDIETHLLLKGYEIMTSIEHNELMKRKNGIFSLVKDLTRFKTFAGLVGKKDADLSPYRDYVKILTKMGKMQDESYVTGAVFEEYIYHLVTDNFDFDDVWLGTLVRFKENISNEFDILMIKENHLHTIECKLVNRLDGLHYIQKLNLIRDYLDDDGKAMLLSVGADNTIKTAYGPIRTQFTHNIRAHAKFSEITIHQSKGFDETEFLTDVKSCFLS